MAEHQSLFIETATVSLSAAEIMANAAIDAAKSAGVEISVAVVDAGGALKTFKRTDMAPFLTVEAAINKAWTASSFGYPTHVWNAYLMDPKLAPLAQLPRMLAVGGGFPITVETKMIGAIGISGGTYEQDQLFAEEGLKAAGIRF